jgi:hypothetical protein
MSLQSHGIGWMRSSSTAFYLDVEWDDDSDRPSALGILYGAAHVALAECDGTARWEFHPTARGTAARVVITPVDPSLPTGGPLHRRIVKSAFDAADRRRARLVLRSEGRLYQGAQRSWS